ncbi:APH-domain-containing protein [Aureobasidium pullulans]|nr:APH-domain-containing protein [Aureobasidium pullulans]
MEFSHNLQMHALPQASPYIIRRFWGIIHKRLLKFSKFYCHWSGAQFSNQIMQLPFGLVLKWSDGTRVEEVLAMEAARKAGMPVPRVICYGEHPDSPHALVSILMTRLPGHELGTVYETLDAAEQETILQEMDAYISSMRTSIRSVRVPFHSTGPFDTEDQMNDYLLYPQGHHESYYDTEPDFLNLKKRVDVLFSDKHDIVYTHGDLKHHNILVHDGHVSGFIDWESAGWYPEYWDFTTALRYQDEGFWWYDFVLKLGGHRYVVYKDAERALTSLTVDSYAW